MRGTISTACRRRLPRIFVFLVLLSLIAVIRISMSAHVRRRVASGFAVSNSTESERSKVFGIVIAACKGSLEWLNKSGVSCDEHDIFVYERCVRETRKKSTAMQTIPPQLLACTTFVILENVSERTGKAHQAYLHHIVHSWNKLHSISAFLKDTNFHSEALVAKLNQGIDFKNLGAETPPVGRRGPASLGLSTAKLTYARQNSPHLINASHPQDYKLDSRYVSFRSVFAASSRQLRIHSKGFYSYLMDFVTKNTNISDCDDSCASWCPACEIFERIWADILRCGERFTPFHAIHSQFDLLWNQVEPKTCYSQGAPLLMVLASDNGGSLCFESGVEELIRSIYIAGILRWDIWLSNKLELCPSNHGNYSRSHFINHIEIQLGLHVRMHAHDYERVAWESLSCDVNLNCAAGRHSIHKVVTALKGIEGRRVVIPSFFRNQLFEGEMYDKGALLVKSTLQQIGTPADVDPLRIIRSI